MPGTFNTVTYLCPHCGRRWMAETKVLGTSTGWTGWLMSTVNQHTEACVKRTPAQRRDWAKKDAKRREQRPNRHTTVVDDFEHRGMKDGE